MPTVNPRSAIRQAAASRERADQELTQAVAAAYGLVPVQDIALAAGISRPTVYAILREAGVELKGARWRVKP